MVGVVLGVDFRCCSGGGGSGGGNGVLWLVVGCVVVVVAVSYTHLDVYKRQCLQ